MEFIVVVGLIGGLILDLVEGLKSLLTDGLKYGLTGFKYGLIGRLIFGWGKGLISGLIFGLVSAFVKIRPVEWTGLRRAKVSTRREALRVGLIARLMQLIGMIDRLTSMVILGLISVLIFRLLRPVASEAIPESSFAVNEGTPLYKDGTDLRADFRADRRADLRRHAERRAARRAKSAG